MRATGIIKRVLPFFAAFAVGLFIASFFVDIRTPRFGGRHRRHQEMKRLRVEVEELRNENLRLINELDGVRRGSSGQIMFEGDEHPKHRPQHLPPPTALRRVDR